MVDVTAKAAVIDAHRLAGGVDVRAALSIVPAAAQFVFRGDGDAALAAGQGFGVTLPDQPCRAVEAGGRAALWLGPDEWLLLAQAESADQVRSDIAASLGGVPHSLVGVGNRNAALHIEGSHSARVLNAGCPLDLDMAAFPVGMCTRTVLAKAQIVLWRTGAERFYVGVWRSFAPYVWDYLVEARTRL